MNNWILYSVLKKMISTAASGIAAIEARDGKLIFTMKDGTTLETELPTITIDDSVVSSSTTWSSARIEEATKPESIVGGDAK